MSSDKPIKRGDLVRVLTLTPLDRLMGEQGKNFIATVLECRYKSDRYRIVPWNSPISGDSYWIEGRKLTVLKN